MPRPRIRIMLPTTTASTASHQSSLLYQNTTSSSPLHPLSPPLKSPALALSPSIPFPDIQPHYHRHQRGQHLPLSPTTFLPSPRKRFQIPPQPSSPLPWTWRCHLCHTTYRLGTTRRCLLDGHYFCSAPSLPPPSSPSPSPSPQKEQQQQQPPPLPLSEPGAYQAPNRATDATTTQLEDEEAQQRKRNKKNKAGQNRASKTCTSSFDYLAWADWNAWRREVQSCSPAGAPTTGALGMRGPASDADPSVGKWRKDCFADCDFPSECSWFRTREYLEAVLEEAEQEREEKWEKEEGRAEPF